MNAVCMFTRIITFAVCLCYVIVVISEYTSIPLLLSSFIWNCQTYDKKILFFFRSAYLAYATEIYVVF